MVVVTIILLILFHNGSNTVNIFIQMNLIVQLKRRINVYLHLYVHDLT